MSLDKEDGMDSIDPAKVKRFINIYIDSGNCNQKGTQWLLQEK